jgi:uncharacterized repeat protein (TIGR01451 family)
MRLLRATSAAILLTALVAGTALGGIPQADLQVTKSDSPDPVAAGANITYSITVTAAGPQDSAIVQLTDSIPPNTTFVSFTAPAGWTVVTPPVGGTGNVAATIVNLPVGASAAFTLVVQVALATVGGTVISNTATVTQNVNDPDTSNNSATATTTVPLPPATPAPTPAASLQDAAMATPTGPSPAIPIGIILVLASGLTATAVLQRRRSRI